MSKEPLIRRGENVVSAGSCFAANLVPYLENAGFTYLRTEVPHASFGSLGEENLSYGKFSAAYGNIYTARQLTQLIRRCLGRFKPQEDRWRCGDDFVDPFRPGMRHKARSTEEFSLLTRQHLSCALDAFSRADVLIYTLGLTEAWVSRVDGAVFPACPGTLAGAYDAEKHAFHNFNAAETTSDLEEFVIALREINPRVRIILTVSPVPLVATATSQHVLGATIYSKSVLRVAAHDVALRHEGVSYFPSYEIVTGPQAPSDFFESTRRDVSKAAIDQVMDVFLAACETEGRPVPALLNESRPLTPTQTRESPASLARAIIEAECEEAMADRR